MLYPLANLTGLASGVEGEAWAGAQGQPKAPIVTIVGFVVSRVVGPRPLSHGGETTFPPNKWMAPPSTSRRSGPGHTSPSYGGAPPLMATNVSLAGPVWSVEDAAQPNRGNAEVARQVALTQLPMWPHSELPDQFGAAFGILGKRLQNSTLTILSSVGGPSVGRSRLWRSLPDWGRCSVVFLQA